MSLRPVSYLLVAGLAYLAGALQQAALPTPSQRDQQQVNALYQLLDSADWTAALTHLQRMQRADLRLYEQNHFPYLEARLLLKVGRAEEALSLLERARVTDTLLERHILQQQIAACRALGRNDEETKLLEELLERFATRVPTDAIRFRLAELARQRRDLRQALEHLNRIQEKSSRRRAAYQRSELRLRLGDRPGAIREWQALISGTTTDDWALKAARALDRAHEGSLDEAPRWRRVEIYSANRDFDAAEAHLKILRAMPAGRFAERYAFQSARNDFQAGHYQEAIEGYRRFVRQYPKSKLAVQADYLVANTLLRQQKFAEAAAVYREVRERYRDDPFLENAFNNEVDALRWQRRSSEAIAVASEGLVEQSGRARLNLLFSRAKIYINQGELAEAEADLRALISTSGPWPELVRPDETRYWLGRVLEQQGQMPAAVEQYLTVFNPDANYYSELARWRIQALSPRPDVAAWLEDWRARALAGRRPEELQKIARLDIPSENWKAAQKEARVLLDADPSIRRVRALQVIPERPLQNGNEDCDDPAAEAFVELNFLHLYDDAADELETLPESSWPALFPTGDRLDYLFHLAFFQDRGGKTSDSVQTAFRLLSAARLPGTDLPSPLAELLYPFHFREIIQKGASRHKLDPYFIAAIIQQESRFDPAAKSPAAARGLLQLVPVTARRFIKAAGLVTFDEDDLYQPEVSIQIGAAYLKRLNDEFGGSPEKVAAAYNAGEEPVLRWQWKAERLKDLFVADVGFAETKKYVLLVMRNYNRYRQIYEQNPPGDRQRSPGGF